jgi:hypothetical protein
MENILGMVIMVILFGLPDFFRKSRCRFAVILRHKKFVFDAPNEE